MINEFNFTNFETFMYTLKDLTDGLENWGKNASNTWDIDVYIGKGEYCIYIEINEDQDKSK